MRYKDANRRFTIVMMTSMGIFLAGCLTMAWAEKSALVPNPVLWVASIIPIVALLTPIWAQWRYVTEIDEFLRSIQIKAILFGLAVLLLFVSSWGFVEMYVDAPPVSMFWLNPLYWIAYSVGALVFTRREGAEI